MDNDVYGHVNNVVYYSYFDTVINEYLIREGGLDIHAGEFDRLLRRITVPLHGAAGLSRDHRCRPARGAPGQVLGALRDRPVPAGRGAPAAVGSFVHVFVAREDERPTAMPAGIRACLERLKR
jgi:acyl-CoA thioester hydrolase